MATCGHLLVLLGSVGLVMSVQRGFVYCPAYPCTCESLDGALIINCRHLYLSALPKFLSFDGRIKELSLSDDYHLTDTTAAHTSPHTVLKYNSIQHIPAHGFQGLHLERLDLLDNAVASVDQHAFTGLENSLRSLSLQLYAMYGLPTLALSGLSRLRSLAIVGCHQRQLLPDLFLNLTALQELELTGCRIADVQLGAFTPISRLKTLNLAHNALQSQHLAEISLLGDLLVLDLSSNDIGNLSRLVSPAFSRLRIVKMASNKLTQIAPETFYNLDFSLEELDVRDNHIDDRALDSLAGLRLLLRLDVSDNNIYNLSGEYFAAMRCLQKLNVANNKVQTVGRHSFQGLGSSLVELDLHGNPLQLIERGTFVGFHVLQKLNLRHTKLGQTFRHYTFDGLSLSLKHLDVSMSQLTIDDLRAISSLTNISDLNASGNNICSMDATVLTTWRQLRYANFSDNNVSTFDSGQLPAAGSSLQTLDLSRNNIQTFHGCGFFVFRQLGDVRLQGNPLACNCSLSGLYRWLQIHQASQHLASHAWTCSSPAALQGSHFWDLQFADLKCGPSPQHGDPCLELYDNDFTDHILSSTNILHPTKTPPCDPLCLNISRPHDNSVYVEWLVGNMEEHAVYNISLNRHVDSVQVQTALIPSSSENFSFVNINNTIDMDVCIVALTQHLVPLVERCHAVPVYSAEDSSSAGTNGLGSLIQNSFLPLLFIYISGSLAVVFLVACVVVCIHRKRKRPRRLKPFYLTYPAWYDNRSSISSTSLVYDPHVIHSGNLHTGSTLLPGRLGWTSLDPDSSTPQDLPSMVSSRRESRLCPGIHNCTCSTVTSVLQFSAEQSLAGRADVDNEFFFHF